MCSRDDHRGLSTDCYRDLLLIPHKAPRSYGVDWDHGPFLGVQDLRFKV